MFTKLHRLIGGAVDVISKRTFIDTDMEYFLSLTSFETYLKLFRGGCMLVHGEEKESLDELKLYIENEIDTKPDARVEIVEQWSDRLLSFFEQVYATRLNDNRKASMCFIIDHNAKG